MRLLATSDIHGRADWMRWLLTEAPKYDGLVVAGDLINLGENRFEQVNALLDWVIELGRKDVPFAFCDGNHDESWLAMPLELDRRNPLPPEKAAFYTRGCISETWTDGFLEIGVPWAPGTTALFPNQEDVCLTSLLYKDSGGRNHKALEEGASLRRNFPQRPWVVLSHEPPLGPIGSRRSGSRRVREMIQRLQPTVVFSGHDHEAPSRNGTCCERIGNTLAFNAGHNADRPYPCHIILDCSTFEFTWSY